MPSDNRTHSIWHLEGEHQNPFWQSTVVTMLGLSLKINCWMLPKLAQAGKLVAYDAVCAQALKSHNIATLHRLRTLIRRSLKSLVSRRLRTLGQQKGQDPSQQLPWQFWLFHLDIAHPQLSMYLKADVDTVLSRPCSTGQATLYADTYKKARVSSP